jgi:enamidase
MADTQEKLVIRHIGRILSGKLEAPLLDGDCVIAIDGRISAIGYEKDLDTDQASMVVDAADTWLAPGLIDSHVHPVIGDYTPRQQQIHWIDSCLHGGVTTMISAGEVHLPGRPKDIVGLKAMAIASQRWYENFRPSGVKMHAGAPILEEGMEEHDFKDLADAGVRLLGEVGMAIVVRVLGLILCALAIQFILAGLGEAIPGMISAGVTSPYPTGGH